MTKPEAIRYARKLALEGRHLNHCMAARDLRERGWKMMNDARRIARRLGYTLAAFGVDL